MELQRVRSPAAREKYLPNVEAPAVLFVDDEVNVRKAVQRTLWRDGVTVHLAESAADALRRLEEEELGVQVVISDLSMPGMDGIAFLAQVRDRWPKLQRMLLTAFNDADQIQRAINEAGVHRFLTKPWDSRILANTVRDCVEQWATAAERDRLQEITNRQNEALLSLTSELEDKVAQRTADLERASRAWRRTFDSIADPLTLVDRKMRIKRANLAVAEAAREDIRGVIGRQCHEVLFGRPEPCEGCPLAGEGQGTGRAAERISVELTDPRNGRLWRMTTWPLHDEGQDELGDAVQVCHYEDITEAVALQRQVIGLEKMAAIGELAGCVAHELNNPLTGILTFSQVMNRMMGENPDIRAFAADIEEAARRCQKIVQSLLDYARPSAGLGEFVEVDLAQLVMGCIRLAEIQPQARKGLRIVTDLPDDLLPVRGNPDALKSVFLNLINNAIQAMDREGELRVEAESSLAERCTRVRVIDSGPGIPDDIIGKIFDPFFTTKAKNKEGTGLGLAIVAKEVRTHGGEIHVENLPEGGACFEVTLPGTALRQGEQ